MLRTTVYRHEGNAAMDLYCPARLTLPRVHRLGASPCRDAAAFPGASIYRDPAALSGPALAANPLRLQVGIAGFGGRQRPKPAHAPKDLSQGDAEDAQNLA